MNKKPRAQHSKPTVALETGNGHIAMCLYVAGNAPNSQQAQSNLAAICQEFLHGRFELEIVDVLTAPMRALADGILVTPSLARIAPAPPVRIVGNLNDRNSVLHALGIT
jgi:circadian clock protein KaiB